jgi:hypothetical protein
MAVKRKIRDRVEPLLTMKMRRMRPAKLPPMEAAWRDLRASFDMSARERDEAIV